MSQFFFLLNNIDFSSIVLNKEIIVSRNILKKLRELDNKLSEKNLKILITSGCKNHLPDVCHKQGKAIDFLVINSTSSENICQWIDVLEIVSFIEPDNFWCEDINNYYTTKTVIFLSKNKPTLEVFIFMLAGIALVEKKNLIVILEDFLIKGCLFSF